MSKGTIIDRVLTFYRTASPDTVRVTHALATEIVAERGIGGKTVRQTVTRRGRKPNTDTAAHAAGAGAASSTSGGN